jgi:hypothetical protein
MTFTLLGITRPDTARLIMAESGSVAGEMIKSVEAQGLAALLVPKPRRAVMAFLAPKNEVKDQLIHQRLLESASQYGAIIPAASNMNVEDEWEALGLIVASQARFSGLLETMSDKVQFEIHITLDKAGMKADALAEVQRHNFYTQSTSLLGAASFDHILLPVAGNDDLLKAIVLIERSGEAALDQAVAAIDALLPDRLTIHYKGPLPALSFASIVLERPDHQELIKARTLLNVQDGADSEDVTAAYHSFVRQQHCHSLPLLQDAGEAAKACKLLRRVAEVDYALAVAGVPESGVPVLATILREGDVSCAA